MFKILICLFSLLLLNYDYSYAIDVTTSSSLNSSKFNAKKMIDKNLNTAWCAKASGNLVVFMLNKSSQLKKIGIVNGYVKNEMTFKNNARVKDADIVSDDAKSQRVLLDDTTHFQAVNILPSNKIKILIHSFYPGEKYNDVCISEIITDGELIAALMDIDAIERNDKALTETEIKTKIGQIYKKLGNNLFQFVDIRMLNPDVKGLRLLLDLKYYSDKYDKVINAEILEYLSQTIEKYFVNANDIVYKVINDPEQRNKKAIIEAFDNYFSSFYFDESKNKFTDKRYTKEFKKLRSIIEGYNKEK